MGKNNKEICSLNEKSFADFSRLEILNLEISGRFQTAIFQTFNAIDNPVVIS